MQSLTLFMIESRLAEIAACPFQNFSARPVDQLGKCFGNESALIKSPF